jgi:maltose alpha-D-glucosyltransferase/alpha-amylase
MVTDEDRDYMYRVYAEDPNARIKLGIRRRLAPLVKGRRKIELMNAMLMSLPGTPVLYYGDEIGMGDNIYLGDRDGVRTPMQWSADRNAGFSRANPQKLYLPVITDPEYHYESNNVQAQQANASSLLWWTKRLIALRKEHEVLGTGNIEFLYPDNNKILAFIRSDGRRRVLVVINLSRFAQGAEIDLKAHAGSIPVEMFGRTPFPAIGERPYFLSLGPHSFYWFTLEPQAEKRAEMRREPARLETQGPWTRIFTERARVELARGMLDYAVGRRWFRGKSRPRKGGRIADVVPLDGPRGQSQLVLFEVEYVEGDPELYVVPLAFVGGEEAHRIEREVPGAVVARLTVHERSGDVEGLLVDGIAHDTPARLIESIKRRTTLVGEKGQLAAQPMRAFKEVAGAGPLVPRPSEFEQTNSSVLISDKMLLKIYRQIEPGPNPELELGRFFTERGVTQMPRMLAGVEYKRPTDKESATLATVQELVPNEGVAWGSALASIDRYFERVLQERERLPPPPMPTGTLLQQGLQDAPEPMPELLGGFIGRAKLLAKRTADMHLLLASEPADPAFAPQPFTGFYQQSLYQGAHKMWVRTCETMRKKLTQFPEAMQPMVREICDDEARIDARLRDITARKLELERIRVHGDLHLGQVLDTGSDFVIIDFEGEPGRMLHERRYKRCPLVDVAGMMRSFHYASESALRSGRLRAEDAAALLPWARAWTAWVRAAYVGEYLRAITGARFVPVDDREKERLLAFYQLEKCIYEIRYELNNRPDWVEIPLTGLRQAMAEEGGNGP